MKKTVRYLLAAALLAGFGVGIWRWWERVRNSPQSENLSSSGAEQGVVIPPWVPPPFTGKPQTELPLHRPVSELPEIPAEPRDQDIALSRAFARRLVPLDGKGDPASDNAAMGEFLRRV